MLLLSVGATAFQCGHRPSFMTAMTRRSQMSSSTDTPLTFADYMARRNSGNQVEAPPPDVSAVEAKARWLAGQSAAEMPLQFIVDQDLPRDIHTITLSYTLFDITDTATDRLASR